MGLSGVINYFLDTAGYSGSGVRPLEDRFIMTDAERTAARKDVIAFMSDNDAMQKYSASRAGLTPADCGF